MKQFDKPRTIALATFIDRERRSGRVVGLSIEADGVFIYTNSHEWCDDAGSGTFRGDSETDAIRVFRARVRKGNGDREYPQPARTAHA